jgi:hypothetical protein
MIEDTIPSDPQNPSGDDPAGNGGTDPIIPSDTPEAELDPKSKEGFQKLVNKKDKEAQEATKRAEAAEAEAARLREERRKEKLSQLDETERTKLENQQLVADNAKLKMRHFAAREWAKKNLKATHLMYEIVTDTPWLVPDVRRGLGDEPSWAEVIQAVEEKLPAYLDQLASKNEETPTIETPSSPSGEQPGNGSPQGDPERQPNDATQKRVWTRKEIAALSDADYLKHRDEIKKAEREGRIIAG